MTDPLLTPSRQIRVREDWLALTREEVLEPGLPIIDPHHHLWDNPEELYLFEQLHEDVASGHDVRATIFVQCGAMYRSAGPEALKSLGETEFVLGAAARSASGKYGPARLCAGIIGYVDLTLGEAAEDVLQRHLDIAGPRFVGIRNRTAWHPDPAIRSNLVTPPPGPLAHPAFHAGARVLAKLGLTLDVWAYHTQLAQVLELARAVPELTVVVDHVGGPIGVGPYAGRRAEVFPGWREDIRALAALPNTRCKLGGLPMHVMGFDYHLRPRPPGSAEYAADWKPYIETCIEAFGAERCMFESNFPVDKGGVGYRLCWNAFKRLAAGASATEKTALFSGTALRTYRLDRLPQGARPDLTGCA